MSERDCAATMAFGMEALAKQPDLLLLGAVASGGQIAAEAITLALFGGEAGDGMTPENAIAVEAAGRARAAIGADPDPLQILRQLGGRETAALAGAILAARSQGVPVVLGGYGAAAAAAILWRADPRTNQHVRAGDAGATPAAGALVRRIGLEPLTAFGVADGEGLGALAALPVLRLACNAAG
jgi:nicotinate-nucleotide--dimethylbenzimidazole phosphoribosyltransferase